MCRGRASGACFVLEVGAKTDEIRVFEARLTAAVFAGARQVRVGAGGCSLAWGWLRRGTEGHGDADGDSDVGALELAGAVVSGGR